jgi:DNA-binding HxlR family transcriptional regulator
MDYAVFYKAIGKRIRVLRLFGGQVCSDWFGYVESHHILLGAIAQSGVSHHTDEIGSTHRKVRKGISMPKRYTPTSAAADVEAALRLLEGRWKLVILFHLFGGKVMRFSDLERAIPDITQKMLGQQLRSLSADGIVVRTAYPQVPPKVEYCLTSWGQSLCPTLDAILKWADKRPAERRKRNSR